VIPLTRLRTLLEWLAILVPLIIIGFLGFNYLFGTSVPAAGPSGLPDEGGFFQTPLPSPQEYTTTAGTWHFTLTSHYTYVLAGKVIGRHEYPATMPDGIIPLDLAVVNGELLRPDILPDFHFTMGDHTLEYSYDVPNYTGLTEDYIDEHISNNHLVFRNSTLEDEMKGAGVGSCLILQGKLVDIRGTSAGSTYQADTSTVRNDSYPAGCEIILVESYTPVRC
jgi:hypothetical protein